MATIGGGLNTTTPFFDPAASAGLQIDYTRNPASFKVNRYTRLVPLGADGINGRYLRIDPIQGTRVTSIDKQRWPFGQPRPKGDPLEFDFFPYECERFQEGFDLPREPTQAAKWDVRSVNSRVAAQRLMTGRTQRTANLLLTTANYPAGQTFAATTNLLGTASPWNAASGTNIQNSIRAIGRLLVQRSGGSIQLKDIVMVMGPGTADRMAASAEIQSYVKNHAAALDMLQYKGDFESYGIPPNLFGLGDVVVEDTVVTTTKKNAATLTTGFMWADGRVGFYARPGALVSNLATTEQADYASVQIFSYEDMSVEVFDNTESAQIDRVIKGGVTDTSDIQLAAPATAALIVDCFT